MNSSLFFTIVNVLIFLGVLALAAQALVGLSFFISSVWEKEGYPGVYRRQCQPV